MKSTLTKTMDSTHEDDAPTGAFKRVSTKRQKISVLGEQSENNLRRSTRNTRKHNHRLGYKKPSSYQQSESADGNSFSNSQDIEDGDMEVLENNPYK